MLSFLNEIKLPIIIFASQAQSRQLTLTCPPLTIHLNFTGASTGGPGPMETPFFYGQETKKSAQYNQTAAALSKFTRTDFTDPVEIVPSVGP